jgi:hypothetical protein
LVVPVVSDVIDAESTVIDEISDSSQDPADWEQTHIYALRGYYINIGFVKTQKVEAALRAASTFWVLVCL